MKKKFNKKIEAYEEKLLDNFNCSTAIDLKNFDSSKVEFFEIKSLYFGWKAATALNYYPVPENHGLTDMLNSYFNDKSEIFEHKLHLLIIAKSEYIATPNIDVITTINTLANLIARKNLDLMVSNILLDYIIEISI